MITAIIEFIFPPELPEAEKKLVRTLDSDEIKVVGNGTLVRDLNSITDSEEFRQLSERYAHLVR